MEIESGTLIHNLLNPKACTLNPRPLRPVPGTCCSPYTREPWQGGHWEKGPRMEIWSFEPLFWTTFLSLRHTKKLLQKVAWKNFSVFILN